jgi:hypothetical protein
MATFITVYHIGMLITNKIGSYEFVRMKNETFLLNEFLTLKIFIGLVRELLGWMDEGCEVCFESRIDIGSSNDLRMKTMSPVCNEKESIAYIGVMMKSDICGIELVVGMVVWNDIGDESSWLLTLPEAIDEQDIICGVVLTQPSQES